MAQGSFSKINVDGVNKLKMELLNYTEQINTILSRLYSCQNAINSNISGVGKSEISGRLNAIIEQIPNVNANINTYAMALGKVVQRYEDQDHEAHSRIVGNIDKLGN